MQPYLLLTLVFGAILSQYSTVAYVSLLRTPMFYTRRLCMAQAPVVGKLKEDMKEAMKSKQKERLKAVKAIQAAIKQHEIDSQKEANEDDIINIMSKLVKKGKESIESYKNAGRDDLVQAEQLEVDTIQSYLPEQLSEDEIDKLIGESIASTGAVDIKGMGKVMKELRPKLAGKADMSKVGDMIKAKLNAN